METIKITSLSQNDRDKIKAEIVYRFFNTKLNGIDDIAKFMNIERHYVSKTINEYLKPTIEPEFITLPSKLNND